MVSLAQNKKYDWKELDEHMSLVTDDMEQHEITSTEAMKRQQDEEQLKKAFKFSVRGGGLLHFDMCSLLANAIVLLWLCIRLWILRSFWVGIAIAWVSAASFSYSSDCGSKKRYSKVASGKKATKAKLTFPQGIMYSTKNLVNLTQKFFLMLEDML